MIEKMQNPKEAIYLVLYPEPMCVSNLCKSLYGKQRNSRASGWITELKKDGWIKRVECLQEDQRKEYYQSTEKGFLKHISDRCKLTKEEKNKLKKFLNDPVFKKYVGLTILENVLNKNKRENFFNVCLSIIIEDIALYLQYLTTIIEYHKYKTGVDFFDKKTQKEFVDNKQFFKKSFQEHVIDLFTYLNLGLPLLKKLSTLLDRYPYSNLQDYFDSIIRYTNFLNLQEKQNVKF